MTAVHQLLPVLSPGDAIGNATLRTQAILRGLGHRSDIYAEVVDQALDARAKRIRELDLSSIDADDIVLYRLSIGSHVARIFELLPARKVIVFHNITPPQYYENVSPAVTHWLLRGEADLGRLAPQAELLIADSAFNLAVARRAGARSGVVIPPPVDFGRLHPRPAIPGQPPQLLFVGRIAPNKRLEVLVRALAVLRHGHGVHARLVVAGNANDTAPYLDGLRRLGGDLGVDDGVRFTGGMVADAELGRLYASSNVFVTASEHEGLCVPILEAMAFSLPVVARAAAAVPETVGEAALLVDDEDPYVFAAAIARAVFDGALRRRLIVSGHQRLRAFAEPRIAELLAQALRDMSSAPLGTSTAQLPERSTTPARPASS